MCPSTMRQDHMFYKPDASVLSTVLKFLLWDSLLVSFRIPKGPSASSLVGARPPANV
jgi:hypothetical protein